MVFGLADIQMRRRFIDQEAGGEERRRREHRRLDTLVAYCEAPECRRQNLLLYFGEESEPCGNCDVCLDPAETVDGSEEARWVLEAIALTGERFGAAHIADIMAGKPNDRITQLRHDAHAVFGIGKAHGRQHWQTMLRQLVGGGFLSIDVAGFGGLGITQKGRALINRQATFQHRRDLARPSKKVERSRRIAAAVEQGGVSDELLQRLKGLRAKLARQRGVPAYVIFNDRTLIDMAAKRPLTRWDFGEVNGVGEAKLQQFAEVFLAEIRAFVQEGRAA